LPALSASPAVASGPPAPADPAGAPNQRRSGRPVKRDECAQLRAECEQLRSIAANAATAAAQAATEAEAAHNEYVAAQRTADEARRAYQAIAKESADLAAQLAGLEKAALTPEQQQLQTQVRDAAFAAYRRGDISSDQMREVFKRAEGWTPDHDRLSRRGTELRAEEAELTRTRDNAGHGEHRPGPGRAVAYRRGRRPRALRRRRRLRATHPPPLTPAALTPAAPSRWRGAGAGWASGRAAGAVGGSPGRWVGSAPPPASRSSP